MSAPTTPPPVYSPNVLEAEVAAAPRVMPYVDKSRYRRAAFTARTLWPGAVGELVSRELMVIEEFGWFLGAEAFGRKLLAAVEDEQQRRETTTVEAQSQTRGVA